MTIIGRRPAGNDAGWGIIEAGTARGAITGRLTANAWITALGARCGRYDSGTPTAQIGVYTGTTNVITTLLGTSATFQPSALMLDAFSGASYTAKPSVPIPVAANSQIALVVRGQNARMAHGQDNSGFYMHQRSVGTSFPSPFNATQVDPQGQLSVWAEATINRAPNTPSGLSPDPDSVTNSTTPTLAADFRDADETVGGYAIGQADKLSAYTFEVWNDAGTTRLQTSGKLTASSAQQTARRATWAAAALGAGRYQFRCVMYDQFGTPSNQAVWKVTVSTGGVLLNPLLTSSMYVATNVTGTLSPSFTCTWSSAAGVYLESVQTRVLDDHGAVVRAVDSRSYAYPTGTNLTFTFAARGWAPLTPGGRYQIEMKGIDAAGGDSPWVRTPLFLVNGPPNAPTNRSPIAGASFTGRPVLEAILTDPDHASSALVPDFRIRPVGDTTAGLAVGASSVGGNVWRAIPDATAMPALGNYEWSVQVADPFGATSPRSTWTAVNWVTPATITITGPGVAGGTITTGTPTVTATVDRAVSNYRIRALENVLVNGSYPVVYDSGTIVGSTVSHTIPAGKLRNGRQYRLEVTVVTADGLRTALTRFTTLSYPVQPALTGVTAAPVAAQFEAPNDPASWSTIGVSWTAPTTTTIPDAEFGGYLVRRQSVATGVEDTLALLRTRGETTYVDRTPRSGDTYAYTPVALRLVNLIDWVETAPASAQAMVRLKHTILSEITPNGLSLPLRAWSERGDTPVRDLDIVPTLGRKPVSFQGLTSYSVISGQFTILDQPEVSATVLDQLAVARELIAPDYDDLGRPIPKALCYRDPRERVLYASVTGYREGDEHTAGLERIDLQLTENATRSSLTAVTP